MPIRAPYHYDQAEASVQAGLTIREESRTQQHHKEDADINTLVRRFGLTGQLPNGINMPKTGDFTEVTDFHSALNVIKEAEAAFLKIPSATRKRFGHDPQQVLEFMNDVNNRDEAIKLGLIEKPPERPREEPKPTP